ncbi:hypothetical protein J3A83DRAFT_1725850 [Scleroderma citrinum]
MYSSRACTRKRSTSYLRIERFVYKTVVLRNPRRAYQFLDALSYRPPEFPSLYVKSLCLQPQLPHDVCNKLLSVCTGLESLALWIPSHPGTAAELITLLSSLPLLTSLSINLTAILSPRHPKPILQNHPVFANITHLDVVNNWALWTSSLGIESLPCVTHLAFRFWARGNVDAALARILKQSAELEVMVLLSDAVVIPGARRYLEKEGIVDVRVVIMKHARDVDEWETMEREGEGLWQRAERVVNWRKRTQAGSYEFPPDYFHECP